MRVKSLKGLKQNLIIPQKIVKLKNVLATPLTFLNYRFAKLKNIIAQIVALVCKYLKINCKLDEL
jgi:hypothetical protein